MVTLLLDSVLVRRVSGHIIIGLCSGEEGEWSPYYWTLLLVLVPVEPRQVL